MVSLFRFGGSLFVGHCRSDQLVEHYGKFATDIEWGSSYVLLLGMDESTVNVKFQQDLKTHFKEFYNKEFLDIDTYTLHKVRTVFKKGVQQLPINIDNFTVNLHGLQSTSARLEDCSHLDDVTEVTAHYVLHHSCIGWLTMKYVLVRIIEQWRNLK